ncbi:MAB_1171c family putative transporter [Streptomyces smyrnaeus]|uniref:MAB_1171c family putative transporter n=1 Tax=Streptomyces smyrnaeus TaxID=1387713 RepID=UPI0036A47CAB
MPSASFVILGLLALVALWRLPSAVRGRTRERSLWVAIAALTAAWLMRTDVGRDLVNGTGIADFGTLLKHIATLVAWCGLLKYVTAVDRCTPGSLASPAAPHRRVRVTAYANRWVVPAAALFIAGLTVVFFFGLDRTPIPAGREQRQFLAWHAGEPATALYMFFVYGCWADVCSLCGYQWAAAARQARTTALRVGLTLMAVGIGLLMVYALVRLAWSVLVAFQPPSFATTNRQEKATDLLLYAGSLVWVVGLIAPATHAVIARCRATRDLLALHGLWRDLALAAPGLTLYRPSTLSAGRRLAWGLNTVRDVFTHDPSVHVRLARFVAEIHDLLHELRRYAPEELYERAEHLAVHQGYTGAQAEAVAKGYWFAAARLIVMTSARPAGTPAPFPQKNWETLSQETTWLRRVAAAYEGVSPSEVFRLLDDVGVAVSRQS